MSKIVDYIANVFGTSELEKYPILTKKSTHYFGFEITLANMAVFHDSSSKPRTIDFKQI